MLYYYYYYYYYYYKITISLLTDLVVCDVEIAVTFVPVRFLDVCQIQTIFHVQSLQHPTNVDGRADVDRSAAVALDRGAAVVVVDSGSVRRRQLTAKVVGQQRRGGGNDDERVAQIAQRPTRAETCDGRTQS